MEDAGLPVVHIVIPSHSTAQLLCQCLDSLRAQEGGLTREIYVVDNASTDDSVERVRKGYPEVHLLASEYNGGFAYAVNLALRRILAERQDQAHPYYVLLLNTDTELPPTALARMVDFMEEHPQAGAAGPRLVMGDGRLDRACRRSFPSPRVAFYRLSGLDRVFPRSRRFGQYNLTYLDERQTTEVDSVCGAFMLVRGQVVETVGLLDEAYFMYGEDLDWAYRIKEQGWKIYYHPQVEVRHWKRASSRQRPWASLRHFYQAMRIFHGKYYAPRYPWVVNQLIRLGISLHQGIATVGNLFRSNKGL
jgi:N-acetylglucosaminyl-diphospho-decaprenol L-rhamnosyltransferase